MKRRTLRVRTWGAYPTPPQTKGTEVPNRKEKGFPAGVEGATTGKGKGS